MRRRLGALLLKSIYVALLPRNCSSFTLTLIILLVLNITSPEPKLRVPTGARRSISVPGLMTGFLAERPHFAELAGAVITMLLVRQAARHLLPIHIPKSSTDRLLD